MHHIHKAGGFGTIKHGVKLLGNVSLHLRFQIYDITTVVHFRVLSGSLRRLTLRSVEHLSQPLQQSRDKVEELLPLTMMKLD